MKTKGFTLIELLATIAILMIILLIAVPRILDIMETARREAFRDTAYLITHTGKLFSAENPGDHEFYYIDSDEYNADGYFLDYSGTKPVTGIVLLNNNGKIAIALHNGTYCATKGGNETLVTITTNTPINCTVENIINTDKTWTEIATNWDIELDDLLDINNESNPNSPTEGLDIIIPVNVTGSTSSGTGDPETDSFTKTYYSMGYVTDEVSFPYSFNYTIELGVLPMDIADITSANVTAKSVFETLIDFKRYIVKRNMGEVIWPGADPVEIDINQASIFQAHANTSGNMTVDDVTVTCDAVTCEANIEVTVNNITGIDLYNINGNDIAYTPLKFTVEFNGQEISCPSNPQPDICFDFDEGYINNYDEVTCGTDVVIPCTIGGVDVISITSSSFEAKEITSIIIPPTVTTIDNWAFSDNSITSVAIPNSVTEIGYNAFSYNTIANLTLGTGITDIGDNAFDYNDLTAVTFPNSLINLSGFGNNSLTSITIPASVDTIGDFAFEQNLLSSVSIPAGVVSIGSSAFYYNNLTSVSLSEGLVTMGGGAFTRNQITSISLPSTITSMGATAFNNNSLPTEQAFIYARNGDGSIDNTTVVSYGGVNRTNVVIPNNVTTINGYAFSSNSLSGVTFSTNLTTIKNSAFQYNSLTTINIPNGVTTIGGSAFYENDLNTVTFPNSLTLIDYRAFQYNNLASITIPASVLNINNFAFASNVLTSITMQGATTTIESYLLALNNNFRTTYTVGGIGTYTGTQSGTWTKS